MSDDVTIQTFPDGGRLFDYHGDFVRKAITCSKCGWSGKGADTTSGKSFGEGVEKHCPMCDEKYSYVQFSVAVAANAPVDWRSKAARVAD